MDFGVTSIRGPFDVKVLTLLLRCTLLHQCLPCNGVLRERNAEDMNSEKVRLRWQFCTSSVL